MEGRGDLGSGSMQRREAIDEGGTDSKAAMSVSCGEATHGNFNRVPGPHDVPRFPATAQKSNSPSFKLSWDWPSQPGFKSQLALLLTV